MASDIKVIGEGTTEGLIVTGPLTDSELRATAVPISGTVTADQGSAASALSVNAWPVRLLGGTGDRAVSVDTSTNTLQSIEYEHHEIHSGSAFSYSNVIDVTGAGTNRDYLLVVPNTLKLPHLRVQFITEAEFNIFLYEDTTTSDDGTPATSYNHERNSAVTATTLIYTAPTVTGVGTLINTSRTGSGSTVGGGFSALEEFVLKQNTKYLYRFNKVATGTHYVTLRMFWYEHTAKTA